MALTRNILITGGCGFIGTHLSRRLAALGNRVQVLDLQRPTVLIPKVSYLQGDIQDDTALSQALQGADLVFHLAAQASVDFCEAQPTESYNNNFIGTVKILEKMHSLITRRSSSMRIIFASSAAVYGNEGKSDKPLSEKDVAHDPISHYGMQKLACEKSIGLFNKRDPRLESVLLRFFNVFGPGYNPRSPYASVIPTFASRIASSRSIQVNGDGKQTRDFVHVVDVVQALIKAAEAPAGYAKAHIYNIGTGAACSVRHLAETMVQLSGRKIRIESAPARAGDIAHSVARIDQAQKLLDWKPTVTLSEGLAGMTEALGLLPEPQSERLAA